MPFPAFLFWRLMKGRRVVFFWNMTSKLSQFFSYDSLGFQAWCQVIYCNCNCKVCLKLLIRTSCLSSKLSSLTSTSERAYQFYRRELNWYALSEVEVSDDSFELKKEVLMSNIGQTSNFSFLVINVRVHKILVSRSTKQCSHTIEMWSASINKG